jgi:hypothetical protein
MSHDADTQAPGVFAQCQHPESDLSVVFEDDGRTAYAYLLRGEKIVADVWIYNRGPAPEHPEWTHREGAPFRNAAAYVRETPVPAAVEDDVTVRWEQEAAIVCLRGRPCARLVVGSKPGWCVFAAKDGPCARVMEHDPPYR